MWEIRLFEGPPILVELDGKRNLTEEYRVLSDAGWGPFRPRYFDVSDECRIRLDLVSAVLPYEPDQLRKTIAKHNPSRRARGLVIRGFDQEK